MDLDLSYLEITHSKVHNYTKIKNYDNNIVDLKLFCDWLYKKYGCSLIVKNFPYSFSNNILILNGLILSPLEFKISLREFISIDN